MLIKNEKTSKTCVLTLFGAKTARVVFLFLFVKLFEFLIELTMIKIFWCNNSNLSNELEAKVLKRIESSDQDFILKRLSDDEDFSRELELKNSQNSIGILVLWINLDNIRLVKNIVKKFNDVLRKKTMLDFIGFVVVFDDTQLCSEIKETLYSEIKELLLQKKRIFVTPFNPSVFTESIKALAEEIQYKQELERLKSQLEKASNRDQIVDVTCAILKDHPLVGYDRMTISLVDRSPDNNNKRYLFHFDSKPNEQQPIRSLLKEITGDRLIEKVVEKTVFIIDNIHELHKTNPEKLKAIGWDADQQTTKDIKSWIGFAAKYQNEAIAIITLDKVDGGLYDDNNLYNYTNRKLRDFLKDFGEIFATHIETYFLKRNKEIIQDITKNMGEKLTAKDLINNILLKLRDGLETDNFNYFSVAVGYDCNKKERYLKELTSANNKEPGKNPHTYSEGTGLAGHILLDGKSRIIPNAVESDEFEPSREHPGDGFSLLAVAVKPNPDNNRIIGIISCYKQEKDYFTVYDRDLLEQVTNVTATLIERTITLESLNAISEEMSKLVLEPNKKKLLEKICQKALEMTSAGSASIHLLDYDENSLSVEGSYKGYKVNKNAQYTFPPSYEAPPRLDGKGVTDFIIDHLEDKENAFVFSEQDKNTYERINQNGQKNSIKSKIAIPLKVTKNEQKTLVGALYLNKYSDETFSEVEKFAIELLGKQAANIIKDQKILWEKTFIADARKKLTEAIQAIARQEDMNSLLRDIAEYAYELITINEFDSADRSEEEVFCFVDMCNSAGLPKVKAAWPEYHLGNLKSKRSEQNKQPGDKKKKGVIDLAIESREPILIQDIKENTEDRNNYLQYYIEYSSKTRSELAVPIIDEKQQKVIGVINLEHSKPYSFTELHQEVIEHFAAQIAIAYQKKKMVDTIKENNRMLTSLHKSLPSIMSETPENLLYKAVSSACNASSAKEFIVIPFSESNSELNWDKVIPSNISSDSFNDKQEEIEKISIEVYKPTDYVHKNTLDFNFNNLPVHGLCLPFSAGEKFGVVWMLFPNSINQSLIKENEEIYKVYVSQIALAYENARRFEKFNNKDKDDLSEDIKTDLENARDASSEWLKLSIKYSLVGLVCIGYGVVFWLTASGFIFNQNNQTQVQSNKNQNPVPKQEKTKEGKPPAESRKNEQKNPISSEQTANFSIIVGLIIQAVPILAFKQATEANKRLDNYHQERINIGKLSL
jgi:GAF domain-containing protein